MIKKKIKLIFIIAATILFLVAAGLLLYMLISTNDNSGILMLVDNLDIVVSVVMMTGIGLILILIYHML